MNLAHLELIQETSETLAFNEGLLLRFFSQNLLSRRRQISDLLIPSLYLIDNCSCLQAPWLDWTPKNASEMVLALFENVAHKNFSLTIALSL